MQSASNMVSVSSLANVSLGAASTRASMAQIDVRCRPCTHLCCDPFPFIFRSRLHASGHGVQGASTVVVVEDRAGQGTDELSVRKGEQLLLVRIDAAAQLAVCARDGIQGLVPLDCLDIAQDLPF